MRKPTLQPGNYYHIYNRGVRGLPIVRDDQDRWRFIKMLYYFNDEFTPYNWKKEIARTEDTNRLQRLDSWPEQQKIVEILAFCLMDNHFHLLLKEIKEGGISLFMRKLGVGLASSYNTKYDESGSLFQGSYKARHVDSDNDLKNLSIYIQVKNPFEIYVPDGLEGALQNTEEAFEFALAYDFCSLSNYAGTRNSPIITKDLLGDWFVTPQSYRDFAISIIGSRSLDHYKELE